MLTPQTTEELTDALHEITRRQQRVTLGGNFSKNAMGGPILLSDESLSTAGLTRVLEYEPRDLTISVEAGVPWTQLANLVAAQKQMIPLDPPFADRATVGGVIATNASGPRRRLYGTARDLVIGMKFATLQGKLVQSGGMVVKNVAGLDMGKLMIGSFGTLAVLASVNFKLTPAPEAERTFLLEFDTLAKAMAARDGVLKSVLQPASLDLLNPPAAATLGHSAWLLVLRVGGNAALIERYEREFGRLGSGAALDGEPAALLWRHIEEFTPHFLVERPEGAVVRASCTLKEVEHVMESLPDLAVARAGSGVCYGYFADTGTAGEWMAEAVRHGCKCVIDFSPETEKRELEMWPAPGSDFEVMKRVKAMFDPMGLLNRGRLYNRI